MNKKMKEMPADLTINDLWHIATPIKYWWLEGLGAIKGCNK